MFVRYLHPVRLSISNWVENHWKILIICMNVLYNWQDNGLRSLSLAGHVGFDSLPDQLVNKSICQGFCFNILCIGNLTHMHNTLVLTWILMLPQNVTNNVYMHVIHRIYMHTYLHSSTWLNGFKPVSVLYLLVFCLAERVHFNPCCIAMALHYSPITKD